MKLKIAIENEMLCNSVYFSLLKKFISKLETLCAETGVCAVANIELGETSVDGRTMHQARFDVMTNERVIHISTCAKNLVDAINNAFDACETELSASQKRA